MIANSTYIGNNSDTANQPAKRGFLVFPLPLLRKYGKLTRTLAAIWATSKGRPTTTHHKTIARLGCLPYSTFNKQLATLKRLGAVIDELANVQDRSRLRLSDEVLGAFRENMAPGHAGQLSHLQITREVLTTYSFPEAVLLTYYRFACRVKLKPSVCCKALPELAELTGLSTRTIADATNRLAELREIELSTRGKNRRVTIPGFEPAVFNPPKVERQTLPEDRYPRKQSRGNGRSISHRGCDYDWSTAKSGWG